MKFDAIDPYVHLMTERFVPSATMPGLLRVCYSYAIFLICEGEIIISINGKEHKCGKDTLMYCPPGTVYRIISAAKDTFHIVNIFFDYDRSREGFPFVLMVPDINYHNKSWVGTKAEFDDAPACDTSFFNEYFIKNDAVRFCKQMLDMYSIFNNGRLWWRQRLHAQLLLLLIDLQQCLAGENRKTGGMHKAEYVVRYIAENYQRINSCRQLANELHYHPNHINRLVKSVTGLSAHNYLQQIKLREALVLLEDNKLPLSRIAAELGYYDYSHFAKSFRYMIKMTPKEYQKLNGKL